MIKDSGARREFNTGAVRDIQTGKGRCDLMPLDVVASILDDSIIFKIHIFVETGRSECLVDAIKAYAALKDLREEDMLLEVSKHFEEGAMKYGEYNWQKGIPIHCYIDSAVRHYLKDRMKWDDEHHGRAFIWNLMCAIWTCEHKPEMMDLGCSNDSLETTKLNTVVDDETVVLL